MNFDYWSEKWDLLMQQPQDQVRSTPELIWHPPPVSTFDKYLGVQAGNAFSTSAQFTKTTDLHDEAFFPRYFEVGFLS